MIEQYIQTELQPTLRNLGISDDIIEIVSKDIKHRLTSIVSMWSDTQFRNAILILGREEAEFYQPEKKNILIRSLVVVAIRNSLLEDLHSHTILSHYMKGINDQDIAKITKEAIQFFSKFNVNKESKKVKGYNSMYIDLAKKYPAAWKALEILGGLKDGEQSYEPYPINKNTEGTNILKPFLHLTNNHFLEPDTKMLIEVQSGIDIRISESIYNQLVQCDYIVTDCFKTLTRNPEKFLAIVEFLFSKNAPLVTTNYYIENGCVSKSSQSIKPSSGTQQGVLRNFKERIKIGDITPNHTEWLSGYIQQIEETAS